METGAGTGSASAARRNSTSSSQGGRARTYAHAAELACTTPASSGACSGAPLMRRRGQASCRAARSRLPATRRLVQRPAEGAPSAGPPGRMWDSSRLPSACTMYSDTLHRAAAARWQVPGWSDSAGSAPRHAQRESAGGRRLLKTLMRAHTAAPHAPQSGLAKRAGSCRGQGVHASGADTFQGGVHDAADEDPHFCEAWRHGADGHACRQPRPGSPLRLPGPCTPQSVTSIAGSGHGRRSQQSGGPPAGCLCRRPLALQGPALWLIKLVLAPPVWLGTSHSGWQRL